MAYLISFGIGILMAVLNIIMLYFLLPLEKMKLFTGPFVWKQKITWFILAAYGMMGLYFGWLLFGIEIDFICNLVLGSYLLAISIVDYQWKQLPDLFHLIYGVVFIGILLYLGGIEIFIQHLIQTLLITCVLTVLYLVKKSLGIGDIKMITLCCLFTGVQTGSLIVIKAMVIAGIYSLLRLIFKKATLQTEVAFAPFLFLGVLL